MKVAINKCFGGFGLSDKDAKRCIELGMTVTEYDQDGNYINENADFVYNKDRQSYRVTLNYDEDDIKNKLNNNTFRTDKRLIQSITELKEEANARFSKLAIIEIPFDSIEGWYVDEYDGWEKIVENHRIWE
jgi:hypothetical protein